MPLPVLRRAVEHYERTLTLDAEDLDAHYGLAECYARLGEVPSGNREPVPVDEGGLLALGQVLADPTLAAERRLQAAAQLCQAIPKFAAQPTQPQQPRLPLWHTLLGQGRQVYRQDPDSRLRSGAAQVLSPPGGPPVAIGEDQAPVSDEPKHEGQGD